jgi:hypothetical protein
VESSFEEDDGGAAPFLFSAYQSLSDHHVLNDSQHFGICHQYRSFLIDLPDNRRKFRADSFHISWLDSAVLGC